MLSDKAKAFIKENYKGVSHRAITEMIADMLGEHYEEKEIKSFCGNNKLRNGLKGGQFQKGHMPHNYVPVGSSVIDSDGYHKIKIADPKTWEYTHKMVWREHYGEIPRGHAIIFKDGNRNNMDINNLLCVSRAELARINQNRVFDNPDALKETALYTAILKARYYKKKKKVRGRR